MEKGKKFAGIVAEMVQIYVGKRVSRSSAAFAYFLTLTIFPTLICVYVILGNFFPGGGTFEIAEGIVPANSLSVIESYLVYISENSDSSMLTAGIIMMATTSAAMFRSLHNIMADIQGEPRYTGVFAVIMSFLFSLILLAAIYFAAGVMFTGNWFITFLNEHFPSLNIYESWSWVRFVLLFLVVVAILYGIYWITAPRDARHKLMPGAIAASLALVVVSMIFSMFIGMSTRYPLVYGTLTSIIILILWLYLCGNIIIMGNALNVVLRKKTLAET